MLYLLERPDQKVELKTIDMVLFFRSVVWFSVCVWGAQTDPPLCGERMIEGGWRWKCSNTGWCTRCRHPPLAPTTTTIALSHAQPPQPHPPPPTAISFFPSIPFSFSQPCGTTISPGRNLQALLHHTRHRGGRGTQCESERRRERQREGEHCTVQISALNIQGRDSACFFSFSHLFLAVPATPKKKQKNREIRFSPG